ncbi:MAG: hypothetical protein HXS41_04815 [Theionarchaea archaeon]|nr:hypothetical protein [Theionarchaea archaeon]MBU7001891.1 hypothetical protein [Theionarchaea archaeon]MBU7020357.1 hypothetical protein [Theionarchaea archaeon]MBU7035796.1 hypothetical protein [Theionarchaea archaeon]MBU7041379.1 hypothetical protein [Theionarchaea archaeon]
MKEFGKEFDAYEPLEVGSILDSEDRPQSVDKFLFKTLARGQSEMKELQEELSRPVVGIAPAANVYMISPDQEDLADFIKRTLPIYNYYVVELGLNVLVGRTAQIPELLFQVTLKGGTRETDVVAYDIAPKDEKKYTELISGSVKITLGISTLLKFVPSPLGEILPDLLNIDINPWEFKWGTTKCMIDTCGEKDCQVYWKVYETDTVQGFNPCMVVRAKKGIEIVSAHAKCIYKLKPSWCSITPRIESKEKKIPVWPA